MGFKLFGRGDVEVQVRRSEAVHIDEGGTYHIGEVALVNTVDAENYVTAAGIALRKDPMNRDKRVARKEATVTVAETN